VKNIRQAKALGVKEQRRRRRKQLPQLARRLGGMARAKRRREMKSKRI